MSRFYLTMYPALPPAESQFCLRVVDKPIPGDYVLHVFDSLPCEAVKMFSFIPYLFEEVEK